MFTQKQVRLLSPFLWRYESASPWKALGRCFVALVIFAIAATQLPLFNASAKTLTDARTRLEQLRRANELGRPLGADTEPTLKLGHQPFEASTGLPFAALR